MATVIRTILTVLFAVDCVAMIIVIMMQKSKDAGLGALSGMNNMDTYWGKNKGRSAEGNLVKITRILAIAFIVIAVLLKMSFCNCSKGCRIMRQLFSAERICRRYEVISERPGRQ